jgi:hypothetical protein
VLAGIGVLLAVVMGLVTFGARLPAVIPRSAPPEVFSAERAMDDVRGLTASGLPHPIGSADHERARRYVEDRLRALGLEPSVQRATACTEKGFCAEIENVVARLAGEQAGPALMLAAHYDSVPKGPGAADDGAGVATLLEVARALRAGPPPRYPVVLLFDDGEEKGLLGARAFVDAHPLAKDVAVVLNFEARGTAGQTAMFETSAGNGWLVEAFARASERPTASSVVYALYKKLPNDTDLTIFKRAGKQGLNFAFADRVWHYHTADDTADNLEPGSLQHMGDQALATTRGLLAGDLATPPGGDAVYFDLFSLTLVRFGTGVARALGALALLACAAGLGLALSRRRLTPLGALRGLGVALAAIAVAVVLGFVPALALGPISPWGPAPNAPFAAFAAAGVLGVFAASIGLSSKRFERSGEPLPWEVAAGVVLVLALFAALSAWKEVGASYLFTLPALATGLALVLCALRPDDARVRIGAPFVALALTLVLWIPLLRVLLVMVGAGLAPAVTVPVAFAALPALPLVVALAPPLRRVALGLAAAALVVSFVLALLR